MKNISFRAELAANLLIIVAAVLVGAVLVQKYFFFAPSMAAQPPARVQPTIGKKVDLPDVDWSRQPKTVVLALQTTCHFCTESAPFYKRLIQSVQGKNIKLIAVFPTNIEDSTAHLNELGLQGLEVKQSSLASLQAGGTPTLIITNDKGEVTNFWVGKLPPAKEDEVIKQLNS